MCVPSACQLDDVLGVSSWHAEGTQKAGRYWPWLPVSNPAFLFTSRIAARRIAARMTVFRQFELEAIRLMAKDVLSDRQMNLLCDAERLDSYEYTGCGYFLSVKHPSLPAEPRTLSEPAVVGKFGDIQAGFVVFLGYGELTLERHTLGPVDVPDVAGRALAVGSVRARRQPFQPC
jgi:hypothetical protein